MSRRKQLRGSLGNWLVNLVFLFMRQISCDKLDLWFFKGVESAFGLFIDYCEHKRFDLLGKEGNV